MKLNQSRGELGMKQIPLDIESFASHFSPMEVDQDQHFLCNEEELCHSISDPGKLASS